MKIVNLRQYPKFWKEFTECLSKYDELNISHVSSSRATYLLQDKFDLYVKSRVGSDFTSVEMDDEEYVLFLLKFM